MTELPKFRYHPDPVASGVIEPSDTACVRCGKSRGYIYAGPVYSRRRGLDSAICPWCIADGTAAEQFDATFADEHPLSSANLSPAIVEEVTQRTLGYVTWQQDEWMACCNDACAFLGDAKNEDLRLLDDERKKKLGIDAQQLEELVRDYVPRSSPAFYKFQCLHCGKIHFHWDCD